LAPLWAYWRLRPSWLVASGLTTLVFPVLFIRAGGSLYTDTLVAAVRNAVLVAGTVAWFVEGIRGGWAGRVRSLPAASDQMEVVPCPTLV